MKQEFVQKKIKMKKIAQYMEAQFLKMCFKTSIWDKFWVSLMETSTTRF